MTRRRMTAISIAVAVLAAVGLAGLNPASGATGDKVKTVIAERDSTSACKSTNAEGAHGSVSTGIAFDGTNLILSCDGSGSELTFVAPKTGAFVKKQVPTGGGTFGALAYDGVKKELWVCNNGSDIGVVNLTANTYTLAFSSGGCRDGLAFDGKDNTIWASGDAQKAVRHYSAAGDLIDTFAVDLAGDGNSGLAVGGDLLYLANDGGAEVFQAAKDNLAGATVFISSADTAGRRVEDLECDNVTFASEGKAVMWLQDAYDNILEAYEIPDGSCTFGGGVTTTTAAPTTTAAVTTTTAKAAAAAATKAAPAFTG